MNSLNGWIEIFRAGDYGDKGSYTVADIDSLVSNYNPAKHEAPVVLGHPENNAPAYGWVESLKRVGDTLMAKLKQVSPQLESWLRSGAYKKRSISFYTEPHLMLRHLGFLGAMPPEVKGLADVKFVEGYSGIIDMDELEVSPRAESLVMCNSQLAKDALEIAERDGLSYSEALTRVRANARWYQEHGA